MGRKCFVHHCNRDGVHQFPSPVNLRKRWKAAITRKRAIASSLSRLCPLHFKSSDYSDVKLLKLKRLAVPSIFPFPNEAIPQTHKEFSQAKVEEEKSQEIRRPSIETETETETCPDREPLEKKKRNNLRATQRKRLKKSVASYAEHLYFRLGRIKDPEKLSLLKHEINNILYQSEIAPYINENLNLVESLFPKDEGIQFVYNPHTDPKTITIFNRVKILSRIK